MSPLFASLGAWNWLIFGLALMILELLAPGVFMFWLGLAALLAGLLAIGSLIEPLPIRGLLAWCHGFDVLQRDEEIRVPSINAEDLAPCHLRPFLVHDRPGITPELGLQPGSLGRREK